MKRYEQYKDSGVAWIGEIPTHWKVCKTKYVANLYTGNSLNDSQKEEYTRPASDDTLPYIATKDIVVDKDIINYFNGINIPKNGALKIAPVDTFLLCVEGGSAGKKMAYNTSSAYFVNKLCCFESRINPRFHYYFIKSHGYANIFKQSIQGLIGGVSVSTLNNLEIAIPSNNEQQAIVRYLDCKVAKIDKLIAENEAQVKELEKYRTAIISEVVAKGLNPNVPMRDSGIQWIGEIPAHWDILPLKRCLASHLMYGANETAESDNPTFPRYIRITDIGENNTLRKDTYKTLSPSVAKDYMLQKGDLLFARSGATVGKTYLYNGEFEACFAGYLIKASFNSKMLPEYAYYFTQTDAYNSWKNQVFIQATIQNIGADKYSVLPICVPPIEEQRAVISSIEDRIKNYNVVIEKLSEQIEELKAYKTALISEAVTGQIDVRDWQEK